MTHLPEMLKTIAYGVTWIVNIIYWVALFPQIILNMRMRTLGGMSELMLFGYFCAYVTYTYYVFCINDPLMLAYKVFVPCCLATVFVVIVQHVYYDRTPGSKRLFNSVLGVVVVAFLFMPLAFIYPRLFGLINGYVAAVLWSIYMLPQVIKIYEYRSLMGLSMGLINLMMFGAVIEFISAITLNFPWPSILMGLRGIISYGIFYLLYFTYIRPAHADSDE